MGLAGKVECRMPELLRRGVNVTLGSDSSRSSAFGDEALAAQLVAANAGEPLAPETILEMLTINAARAAGLGEMTGSLEAGKRADFVVTDPDAPEAFPAANPLHQAVLTCRGQARTVVVNGEVVIDEGRSTRLDEGEACAAARASVPRTDPAPQPRRGDAVAGDHGMKDGRRSTAACENPGDPAPPPGRRMRRLVDRHA